MNLQILSLMRLIVAFFGTRLALFGALFGLGVGLFPDEAQYWTWSRELSYGYYSKPLGISYQIAAGCAFFKSTEFGVRFFSMILSLGLCLGLFFLLHKARVKTSFAMIGALAFQFSPFGVCSSFIATTDCGFVFFLTCATLTFCSELQKVKQRFLITGILIAIGVFWKWTILLFWIPCLLFSLITKKCRVTDVLIGALISLLGLIPSLIWNIQHNFASLWHVTKSINVVEQGNSSNLLDFLLAQIGLFSPVLFILIFIALFIFLKDWKKQDTETQFFALSFTMLFSIVLVVAACKKIPGNWAVVSFPFAFALLGKGLEKFSSRFCLFVKIGIFVSVLMVGGVFGFLHYAKHHLIPYRKIPFKEGLGWSQLSSGLENLDAYVESEFLFSDTYQGTSIASFYGPTQKRAYFFNIHGLRKNQFCFWPTMKDNEYKNNGLFITFIDGERLLDRVENVAKERKKVLSQYFRKVISLGHIVLLENALGPLKAAVVLRCIEYNGTEPVQPEKY